MNIIRQADWHRDANLINSLILEIDCNMIGIFLPHPHPDRWNLFTGW